LIPYATGDLDRDGKAGVIGQHGYEIHVYASVDPESYPTRLVWSSPNLSSVTGHTTVGDTERDGRMEIIHSRNPFAGDSQLYIYENTADDTYEQVYWTVVGVGANREKVVADLDGDIGYSFNALGDLDNVGLGYLCLAPPVLSLICPPPVPAQTRSGDRFARVAAAQMDLRDLRGRRGLSPGESGEWAECPRSVDRRQKIGLPASDKTRALNTQRHKRGANLFNLAE
jgi:hypothetical protein